MTSEKLYPLDKPLYSLNLLGRRVELNWRNSGYDMEKKTRPRFSRFSKAHREIE
jgi:hypothetical protein